jgi:prevent-host-death family protein
MDEIGIEKARTTLGEIVDKARLAGASTLITRKGKPAAVVHPVTSGMKLFIWENVLTDYTSGMIVALAPDLETAFATVKADTSTYDSHLEDMGKETPVVVDLTGDVTPQAWWVYGGG